MRCADCVGGLPHGAPVSVGVGAQLEVAESGTRPHGGRPRGPWDVGVRLVEWVGVSMVLVAVVLQVAV